MGSCHPDKYPGFGRCDSIIIQEAGIDYVVANENNRVQRYSAYQQWDITQKLLYQPAERVTHLVNFQVSNSGDIPRYDRLQDKRYFNAATGTTLRYAEWYYGPQTRYLGAYELTIRKAGFLDDFRLNINYQDISESRQQREYRRYDRFDRRREKVKVAAFTIDGKKSWGSHEIVMGMDGQLNDVRSEADRKNLITGELHP